MRNLFYLSAIIAMFCITSCNNDDFVISTEVEVTPNKSEMFTYDAFSDSIIKQLEIGENEVSLRAGTTYYLDRRPNAEIKYNNQKWFIRSNPTNGWNPFTHASSYPFIVDYVQHQFKITLPTPTAAIRPIIYPEYTGWSGGSPNNQDQYVWIDYDYAKNTATLNTRVYYVKSNILGQGPFGTYPLTNDKIRFNFIVYYYTAKLFTYFIANK